MTAGSSLRAHRLMLARREQGGSVAASRPSVAYRAQLALQAADRAGRGVAVLVGHEEGGTTVGAAEEAM